MNKLRKLAWKLGLTKEGKEELSDMFEVATVSKYHDRRIGGPHNGFFKRDNYIIKFEGVTVSFELYNKELFKDFNIGDKVRLNFKIVYDKIYDYIPPNFNDKQLIEKVLSHYKFVSAEKQD